MNSAFGPSLRWHSSMTIVCMMLAMTLVTAWLCNGHFVYSLDDPYITLSLGWHIWQGHYGVNSTEFSSPSSSILFPFVLAAFGWSSLQTWVPLLINTLCAAGTAAIFATLCIRDDLPQRSSGRLVVFVVALCVAINILGIAFMGLEHSAHTLAVVAGIYGLVVTFRSQHAPWWLVPVLVLSPLLRFEGVAFFLLATVALAIEGHRVTAIAATVVGALCLGSYAMLMQHLGLPLLPSSVLVKATVLHPSSAGSVGGYALMILSDAADRAWTYKPALLAWLGAAAAIWHPVARLQHRPWVPATPTLTLRQEFLLAFVAMGTLLAHTLFGVWGGYHRYEIYAVAGVAATVLALWQYEIGEVIVRLSLRSFAIGIVVLLAVNVLNLRETVRSPIAGRNMYEQQYQMRRLVLEEYHRPVAVNDLGWVSYQNPYYVLDLWGLANEDARKARMENPTPGWPERLVLAHDVGLVMIYAGWFKDVIPAQWIPVATLHSAHGRVTAGEADVSFYATSAAAMPAIQDALQSFARRLPESVATLDINPNASSRNDPPAARLR